MRLNTFGKVVISLVVLALGYGTSLLFIRKTKHSESENGSLGSESIAFCSDREEIQALMGKVEKVTDLQSPYSISIPLLGAAYLNDRELFSKWENALFQAFKIHKEESEDSIVEKLQEKASFNAWILGRLLVANLEIGDLASSEKIASVMEELLKKSPADSFAAWARGYLAIFYAEASPQKYPFAKKQMMEATDALIKNPGEKGKDNVLWAIVMELQSFSDMEDRASYMDRLQQMQNFSDTFSVTQALESIPLEDFRAWATSLTLRAAKKMEDRPLISALAAYLPKTIASSPSDGDKMLALLVRCSN